MENLLRGMRASNAAPDSITAYGIPKFKHIEAMNIPVCHRVQKWPESQLQESYLGRRMEFPD